MIRTKNRAFLSFPRNARLVFGENYLLFQTASFSLKKSLSIQS